MPRQGFDLSCSCISSMSVSNPPPPDSLKPYEAFSLPFTMFSDDPDYFSSLLVQASFENEPEESPENLLWGGIEPEDLADSRAFTLASNTAHGKTADFDYFRSCHRAKFDTLLVPTPDHDLGLIPGSDSFLGEPFDHFDNTIWSETAGFDFSEPASELPDEDLVSNNLVAYEIPSSYRILQDGKKLEYCHAGRSNPRPGTEIIADNTLSLAGPSNYEKSEEPVGEEEENVSDEDADRTAEYSEGEMDLSSDGGFSEDDLSDADVPGNPHFPVSESNLPRFMGYLEQNHERLDAEELTDSKGDLIRGNWGDVLRDIHFLPRRIPFTVSSWQIGTWMAQGAELGDVAARIHLRGISKKDTRARICNALSMRLQRFRRDRGGLGTNFRFRKATNNKTTSKVFSRLTAKQILHGVIWPMKKSNGRRYMVQPEQLSRPRRRQVYHKVPKRKPVSERIKSALKELDHDKYEEILALENALFYSGSQTETSIDETQSYDGANDLRPAAVTSATMPQAQLRIEEKIGRTIPKLVYRGMVNQSSSERPNEGNGITQEGGRSKGVVQYPSGKPLIHRKLAIDHCFNCLVDLADHNQENNPVCPGVQCPTCEGSMIEIIEAAKFFACQTCGTQILPYFDAHGVYHLAFTSL
jgi:hypothetical protein